MKDYTHREPEERREFRERCRFFTDTGNTSARMDRYACTAYPTHCNAMTRCPRLKCFDLERYGRTRGFQCGDCGHFSETFRTCQSEFHEQDGTPIYTDTPACQHIEVTEDGYDRLAHDYMIRVKCHANKQVKRRQNKKP